MAASSLWTSWLLSPFVEQELQMVVLKVIFTSMVILLKRGSLELLTYRSGDCPLISS